MIRPRGQLESAVHKKSEPEDVRWLEIDLPMACEAMAFDLAYQPQVDVSTRAVTGFEALIRWDHPTRGAVSPSEFIPVAEKLGLIHHITEWVLKRACREAMSWPDDISIAVNVSAAQLGDGTLPTMVSEALRASGLAPARLELEITETAIISTSDISMISLHGIRKSGVRIAIDDFDAGFSSFGYLLRFPFDKIKIDLSFTERLGRMSYRSDVARTVVRAFVRLSKDLSIDCSAEGVETEEQFAVLRDAGCSEVQGYLFGQPVVAADIADLLRRMVPSLDSLPRKSAEVEFATISFPQIVDTANDIIIVTTADLEAPGPRIIYVNPAFTRLTGYTAAEVTGKNPRILQGPGSSRVTLDTIGAALRAGRPVHEKVLNFAKSGAPYWLDLRIVALRDAGGTITHFAAVQRDVTLDKRRLDELGHLADRDTLTGIPNRRVLLSALQMELDSITLSGDKSARGPCVAFIDVDRFKHVNDEFGHAVGDTVLCSLADRLVENVRRLDMVARLGGDEFAVCMPSATLADGKMLAERLRRVVEGERLSTLSAPVRITVSIGVTCWTAGDSVGSLLERADAAMYLAKKGGRNLVRTQPLRKARAVLA